MAPRPKNTATLTTAGRAIATICVVVGVVAAIGAQSYLEKQGVLWGGLFGALGGGIGGAVGYVISYLTGQVR